MVGGWTRSSSDLKCSMIQWKEKRKREGWKRGGLPLTVLSKVQIRSCYRDRNVKETVGEFLLQHIVKFVIREKTNISLLFSSSSFPARR